MRIRGSAAFLPSAAPYRAPEACLGDSANFPTDVWAYGCVLEELAHRRISFPGKSDLMVINNILKRFGTPMPPHPLRTLGHGHTSNSPSFLGVGLRMSNMRLHI